MKILQPSECQPATSIEKAEWRKYQRNVRQSMAAIPQSLQWIVTTITGKPLRPDEYSWPFPKWLDVLLTPLVALGAIMALVHLAQLENPTRWLGIVPLWLILVGALRKIQVTHLHHAIHNSLFDNPTLNQAYAAVMPQLICVQNAQEYRREHLAHHRLDIFTLQKDADAAFLAQLGFLPGRSRDELWLNLWMTVCSPVFHLVFAKARLGSMLLRNTPVGTGCAVLSVGAGLAIFAAVGWQAYLIAVLIPMFPLYHVSALLQFLTEHAWNVTGKPVQGWEEYQQRCWGRFCGEPFPCPPADGMNNGIHHAVSIFRWCLRMLLLHLPVRLSCLVADLPAHDWHHLAHRAGQKSRDWYNSLTLREQAIANGDIPGFATRELWGMENMIEHQFCYLESLALRSRVLLHPRNLPLGNVAG